jgi:SAM-dependent methyltransferase
MADHFKHIYQHRAEDYERLIAREDYQGNILKTLQEICSWQSAKVIEFGAGTGRLTRLLAPLVERIIAGDAAWPMLQVARRILSNFPQQKWAVVVTENRQMPFPSGWADVTIEGWSFGHLRGWYPDTWQTELQQAVDEMQRLLRPGGTAILMETLGTGFIEPAPPTPGLAQVYALLENELGFAHRAISTDYQFTSLDEAIELADFFFGPDLAATVRQNNWVILPEWTGVWWWQKPIS